MDMKFHEKLKQKIHVFVVNCYRIVKKFPREEKYGLISQMTRASISIMLNYVEGYARRRNKVKLNFYEISHGSTQECKYILYFAYCQKWIAKEEYLILRTSIEEITKMLWATIDLLERKIENES